MDRRAAGCRDVDAEVKGAAGSGDARVAEEPAHGVLLVEWLDRPRVRRRHPLREREAVDARVVRGERARIGERAATRGDGTGRVAAGVRKHGAVLETGGKTGEPDLAVRAWAAPDSDQVEEPARL